MILRRNDILRVREFIMQVGKIRGVTSMLHLVRAFTSFFKVKNTTKNSSCRMYMKVSIKQLMTSNKLLNIFDNDFAESFY